MKALQLHYTSCRRGQSGNAGFQTRALSAGIRPDEQREIERRGIYRPPRNVRPDPSPEEIARDFPRALRFYRLESGRLAITHSAYVGRDYSGRWGNFFAHTLVLLGDLPKIWPIDLYEWTGWKTGLSPEEDTEEAPTPLSELDLAHLAPAESFRFDELRAFLLERPERPELLARMGRAVLLGRESSRALVVRDEPLAGLYWIACVQKLFPLPHAIGLGSSTYQDDPRGSLAINATTGETDFTFDEAERRFRFYEFDLAAGNQSDLPQAADDYPARVARWMAEDVERLRRFYAFLERFDHSEIEPALRFALGLFELADDGAAVEGGDELVGMIGFADRHARPEARLALLEVLGRAADLPAGLPQAEGYEPLIRFLAAGARASGRPEHRAFAFRAWCSLLRRHLLSGVGTAAAQTTWELLAQELGAHSAELAALVLAEPAWLAPGGRLSQLPQDLRLFLLRTVGSCLELARRLPVWQQKEIESLVAACISGNGEAVESCHAVLAAIPAEIEPLFAICRRLRDLLRSPNRDAESAGVAVGRALGRVLSGLSARQAAAVRLRLEAAKEWDFLFGEWLDRIDRAADPIAAYADYLRAVLTQLPGYQAASFARIAGSLLDQLPEEDRPDLALAWLRGGEVDRFPPDLARTCLAHANRSVALDPASREGEEAARLVLEAAGRRKFELRPNRPLLRKAWTAARSPHTLLRDLHLDLLTGSLGALEEGEHAAFLQGVLRAALERVGSQKDHQQVLSTLVAGRPDLLGKSYLTFFKSRPKTAWPESLHGALRFWLAFEPNGDEPSRLLAPLEKDGFKGILFALERLAPADLEKVKAKLSKSRLEGRALGRWQNTLEDLKGRKKNPVRRVLGWFRR